ncbi:MAG TPA: hypothetical protein VLQ78_00830 [Ornithinibacter sp.]|nr:hypothetical protein [Ornithinibacter sp.]
MSGQRSVSVVGMASVLAGFVTGALSRIVESGFFHGAFQGMTVTLMVLGAFIIGRGLRATGRAGEGHEGSMWLPSRDRRE